MFADAVSQAQNFTRPIVVSWVTPPGICKSTVGAYIIVNDQGWILTAYHMIELIKKLGDQKQQFQTYDTARGAIIADASITEEIRNERLAALVSPDPNGVKSFSPHWGVDGWIAGGPVHSVAAADIALLQLQSFDPSTCRAYNVQSRLGGLTASPSHSSRLSTAHRS